MKLAVPVVKVVEVVVVVVVAVEVLVVSEVVIVQGVVAIVLLREIEDVLQSSKKLIVFFNVKNFLKQFYSELI